VWVYKLHIRGNVSIEGQYTGRKLKSQHVEVELDRPYEANVL